MRSTVPDVVAAVEGVEGVDAAVYVIHGLDMKDFPRTDREAAENMRDAVDREGVGRVVYLSGIIPDIRSSRPSRAGCRRPWSNPSRSAMPWCFSPSRSRPRGSRAKLDPAGPDQLTYPKLLGLYADVAHLTRVRVPIFGFRRASSVGLPDS